MKVDDSCVLKRTIWDLLVVDDVRNCRKIVGYKDDEEWECPYRYFGAFVDSFGDAQPWALVDKQALCGAYSAHVERCRVCSLLAVRTMVKEKMKTDPEYALRKWKENFKTTQNAGPECTPVTIVQIREALAKKASETTTETSEGVISDTDEIECDLDCLDIHTF